MRFSAACRAALGPALALGLLVSTPARATMPPASGPLPPELASAFAQGIFAVPAHPPGLETSSARAEWVLPIIRVAFSDSAIVYPRAALERRLFDSTGAEPTGSMHEYYLWASGRRLSVRGEVVATVLLPKPRNFYANDAYGVNANGTPNNSYGLFRDAITACDAQVDFSRFDRDGDGFVDMLWIVHAGTGGETSASSRDLWSITTSTSAWRTGAVVESDDPVPGAPLQHMRLDRFTILPELSGFHPGQMSEIGVYCHEFGHTLGLPDLYDTKVLGGTSNVGPGNWSLMSTGAYGGDGLSPESPSDFGAWSLLWLGWANKFRPREDTTVVLAPVIDGGPLLEFWFQGEDSPEHFLIENRVRESFDRKLPNDGLIVNQVDEAVVGQGISGNRINAGLTPGLRILEADGEFNMWYGGNSGNRGDRSDPFPGQLRRTRLDDLTTPSSRTFAGTPTNISLDNITRVGRDVSLRVHVRAPGWAAAGALGDGANEPLPGPGPAPHAAVATNGRAWLVNSEWVAGRLAVVVRERPWLEPWTPPVPVDRGIGAATEPTLARVGAEDLAVAWIESQNGIGQVCYRARVRGRWGVPRVLTSAPEGCVAPAIAADARGRVYLSWLETVGNRPQLRFMGFLYAAPYGQVLTLTLPADLPTPPTVTAAGDGHAYVLWPDLGTGPHTIYACRFSPDSGMSAHFRIGPNSVASQPSVSAVVDTAGVLHSVWQVSPGSGSEIHYQRRQRIGRPSQRDTTIEAIGDALQNPRIALDPTGGIHVAYERAVSDGQQVRYKRWTPGLGWDTRATEVSDPSDLATTNVEVLPTSAGNVTLTWIGTDGVAQHLRQRERRLEGNLVLDAPPLAVHADAGLTAGPNPLRAGEAVEFAGDRLLAGALLDVFDAAGRRVATPLADANGRARLERGETRALPAGLYFARVRGTALCTRLVVLR